MKNAIIIIEGIMIIILVVLLFKNYSDKSNEIKYYKKFSELEEKTITEMTKEEWKIRNWVLVDISQKLGKIPDTISYEVAKKQAFEEIEKELEEEQLQRSFVCNESQIINAFHEIMEFNMPHEKYDKKSINIQKVDNCTLRINVTTRNPHEYNWKTFYVFEVFYDETDNNYKMKTISSKFLG
jgi:hypothetical protein